MKKFLMLSLVALTFSITAQAIGIGQWKYYLGYRDITCIEPADNKIFVLSGGGLFAYNTNDDSITTYDRMNGLNGVNISFIAWSASAKKLLIVYNDFNIDLLDSDGNVTNISDYYNASLNTGKKINNVTIDGYYAYLTTQFGIIKLNMKKAEFADTYNLGININDVAIKGNYIYASSTSYHTANTTKNGSLLCGDMNKNLLDKANWTVVDTLATTRLFNINDNIVGVATTYTLLYSPESFSHTRIGDNYKNLQYVSNTGGRLHLVFKGNTSYVDVKNRKMVNFPTPDITILSYDRTNNCFWADQTDDKLQAFILDEQNNLVVTHADLIPDGPNQNHFNSMRYHNDKLYSCPGALINQTPYKRPGGFQVMTGDNEWQIYQDRLDTIVNSSFYDYVDVLGFDIDPNDDKHVFFGAMSGLYEFYDGAYKNFYTFNNSMLAEAYKGARYRQTVVSGMIFDPNGDLIVMNDYSPNNLLKLTKEGEWVDITPPQMRDLVPLMQVNDTTWRYDVDCLHNLKAPFFHKGYLWIVNESWRSASLIRVDLNSQQAKLYNNFTNQDGSEVKADFVTAATVDNEGNIWIGTHGGLMMLTADEIASDGSQLIQVKVPRNDGTNLADYLLENMWISNIAIDKAGRKWIGTYGNGVYLISADNMQEIYHFLSSNSPLLGNNVESIAINDKTGEVFFGTEYGLCSFMSDTVTPAEEMEKDNVYAYPNPVRPDYTGLITVTGLSLDADVKIVTANGTLVAQGRSNGGIFTWDGCDTSGKRVATGVYMVLTATAEGKKGVVTKIAVIR